MYLEYRDAMDLTLVQAQSILAKEKSEDRETVLVFGDGTPNGPMAMASFDLFLAFQFLVQALIEDGVDCDDLLQRKLQEIGLECSGEIENRFTNFKNSFSKE